MKNIACFLTFMICGTALFLYPACQAPNKFTTGDGDDVDLAEPEQDTLDVGDDGAFPDQPDVPGPDGPQDPLPEDGVQDPPPEDGTLDPPLEVEDIVPDTCSSVCGNSIVECAEECDDGNTTDGDGCSGTCTNEVSPVCGDGILQTGEQCDLGSSNDDNIPGDCPAVCRTSCDCPYCGDGVSDFVRLEECDDGNTTDGDGCSHVCLIELIATCGDGVLDIDRGEECDDGNSASGDGCSGTCQFEPMGHSCGDSVSDPLEKCDDGNTINGDGCNPTCNLTTAVSTLAGGLQGNALAIDDTYLWIGTCFPSVTPTICEIQRIDIDACLRFGNCTPVTVAVRGRSTGAAGHGTSAVLSCTGTMTTDGNTLWFGNQHTIRAMDVHSLDVVTLAGSLNSCAAIDGTGSNAYFHDIRGLTYYNGYVYLLDGCEEVLRRFDPTTRTVVTLAGQRVPDPSVTQVPPYTCSASWSCVSNPPMDGYGLSAVFGSPRYMTADHSGNLYITDTNGQSIRSYNIVTTWVRTLVGGLGYQDGIGPAVRVERPRGITSDGTSVYWGEQTAHTIRQMIIDTLETSTMVGVRGCPGPQDGVGGDGTRDWSVPGCTTAPSTLARIDTPLGGIVYHFPSSSIFIIENGHLRWIE